jgi:hypothetical protein
VAGCGAARPTCAAMAGLSYGLKLAGPVAFVVSALSEVSHTDCSILAGGLLSAGFGFGLDSVAAAGLEGAAFAAALVAVAFCAA